MSIQPLNLRDIIFVRAVHHKALYFVFEFAQVVKGYWPLLIDLLLEDYDTALFIADWEVAAGAVEGEGCQYIIFDYSF